MEIAEASRTGRDADLLTIAAGLGLQVKNQRSVRLGRIAVADR
jgi:hypothetical protein